MTDERYARDHSARWELREAASRAEFYFGGEAEGAEYDRQRFEYGLISREQYELAKQERYYRYVIQWLYGDQHCAENNIDPDLGYPAAREWRETIRPRVERELDESKRAGDAGERELTDREQEMIAELEKTRRAEERNRREQDCE